MKIFFRFYFISQYSHLQDDGILELTIEQQKELCLTIPCRVELFHSNVCAGVEKSWPKRMFGQDDFRSLGQKQRLQIKNDMERKAVLLYNKYVDENYLAKRLQNQTNLALAPYLELNYRKNLFQRIEALGKSSKGSNFIDNHHRDNV